MHVSHEDGDEQRVESVRRSVCLQEGELYSATVLTPYALIITAHHYLENIRIETV